MHSSTKPGLSRELGLLGLIATGACSMMGAGINIVPIMVQRSAPGIGPWVFAAYAMAALPALLAAFSYAILSSAMPRAGGSYVFASRSLSPYLGFVASFSQWFGLSMAIGGEAKNPERNLPIAIVVVIVVVASYYLAFTAAVYHAVPWNFVAERAITTELTAPGLLGYLLSPGWTVLIVAAAIIGLVNDLPAMILSVSRLLFAWAEDEIFPAGLAAINERYHTPHWAIALSALTATSSIVLSYSAGDFLVGIDLMVTAMLVNFLLMTLSVLNLARRNPELASKIRFMRSRTTQVVVAGTAAVILATLIGVQIVKDVSADTPWYFHAFYLYLIVLVVASWIFFHRWSLLRRRGVDLEARFSTLPEN